MKEIENKFRMAIWTQIVRRQKPKWGTKNHHNLKLTRFSLTQISQRVLVTKKKTAEL